MSESARFNMVEAQIRSANVTDPRILAAMSAVAREKFVPSAARALAYGEPIEYSGPLSREVTTDNHALRVWFTHTGGGLTGKNGSLRGFEVAGADRNYVPAQASIDGDTVIVSSLSVKDPLFVRYGWAASPDCNLYNGAGLPASPFELKAFNYPLESDQ